MSAFGWFSLFHSPHGSRLSVRQQKVLALDRFLFCLLFILVAHFALVSRLEPYLAQVLGTQSHLSTKAIADGVNAQRQSQNLSTLKWNDQLAEAAQKKANDMVQQDYWSHQSPTGKEPWDFFDQVGYRYSLAGENLARNFTDNQDLINAWMTSPTHRENVLQKKYEELGIAVVQGLPNQSNRVVVVALFGTPSTAAVTDSPRKPVLTSPFVTGELNPNSTVLGESTVIKSIDSYRVGTLVVLGILIMLLFVDVWQAHHRKLRRSVNKILAHVLLLAAVVITVLVAEGSVFF